MPEMDGIGAASIIRKLNKEVQIIIQSAFVEIEDNRVAIEAGANEFITKPINKNMLLNIIDKVSKKRIINI